MCLCAEVRVSGEMWVASCRRDFGVMCTFRWLSEQRT